MVSKTCDFQAPATEIFPGDPVVTLWMNLSVPEKGALLVWPVEV
jgi:hypothetical protein